jgi:hypothetical protein
MSSDALEAAQAEYNKNGQRLYGMGGESEEGEVSVASESDSG